MVGFEDKKIIVNNIMNAYIKDSGVFEYKSNLLEYQIPNGVVYASKEHAMFYFFLIFNDHGTKSTRLYENFKKLFGENSNYFNPKKIANLEDELKEKIAQLGVRYANNSFKYWVYNAQKIVDEFDGDIYKLFTNYKDATQLYKKIKEFKGYGDKTTGLLLRVIDGVEFTKLENFEQVPLPVDTHDSKIAINCNMIEKFDYNKADRKTLQNVSYMWQDLSNSIGINWEELDKALWILGSVGCVQKECGQCPINMYCRVPNNDKNLFNY